MQKKIWMAHLFLSIDSIYFMTAEWISHNLIFSLYCNPHSTHTHIHSSCVLHLFYLLAELRISHPKALLISGHHNPKNPLHSNPLISINFGAFLVIFEAFLRSVVAGLRRPSTKQRTTMDWPTNSEETKLIRHYHFSQQMNHMIIYFALLWKQEQVKLSLGVV
jgi:hypothetical protein